MAAWQQNPLTRSAADIPEKSSSRILLFSRERNEGPGLVPRPSARADNKRLSDACLDANYFFVSRATQDVFL